MSQSRTSDTPPTTIHLRIQPWSDPVLDTLGFDPRSLYVESFWLPTLGPTCVMLLRHLADRFDDEPDGFVLDTTATSVRLGIGARTSVHAPLRKALTRLITFDFAGSVEPSTIMIRRHLPPLNQRHARRLPDSVRFDHDQWIALDRERPPHEGIRRRARANALIYFEQGVERDLVERWLERTGFPPRVARDATVWAYQRHRDAHAHTSPPPAA